MPGVDLYMPEGALSAESEQTLIPRLTDLLIESEGVDPANPNIQSVSKVFVHRTTLYVAGDVPEAPHYKLVVTIPEGQYSPDRWKTAVARMTDAVLDAEQGTYPRNPSRVWVMLNEVPDGTWGARGEVHTLADIAGFVFGDAARGRQFAQERILPRRRMVADALLAATRALPEGSGT